MNGPKAACTTYLQARYQDLANGIVALQAKTGLIHADPNDGELLMRSTRRHLISLAKGNVHWGPTSNFIGLIDFGNMRTQATFAQVCYVSNV